MKVVKILAYSTGEQGQHVWVGDPVNQFIPASRILSVEDYVEPLPAAPGICFLGKTRDTGPQRWFVRMLDDSSMCYLPARGGRAVRAEDAEIVGLVRLPDPKPSEPADR